MSGEEEKTMSDTRSKSLSEAFVNSFGSYPIGYTIGLIVLPLSVSWIQKDPYTVNILITLVYASVSFVRIYFLRRLFVKIGFDDNFIRLGRKVVLHIVNISRCHYRECFKPIHKELVEL